MVFKCFYGIYIDGFDEKGYNLKIKIFLDTKKKRQW